MIEVAHKGRTLSGRFATASSIALLTLNLSQERLSGASAPVEGSTPPGKSLVVKAAEPVATVSTSSVSQLPTTAAAKPASTTASVLKWGSLAAALLQTFVSAPLIYLGKQKIPLFTVKTWLFTDGLVLGSCVATHNTMAGLFSGAWTVTGIALYTALRLCARRTGKDLSKEIPDPFQEKCRKAVYVGWGVLIAATIGTQVPAWAAWAQVLQTISGMSGAMVSATAATVFSRQLITGRISYPTPNSRRELLLQLVPWAVSPICAGAALVSAIMTEPSLGNLLVMTAIFLSAVPNTAGQIVGAQRACRQAGHSLVSFLLGFGKRK